MTPFAAAPATADAAALPLGPWHHRSSPLVAYAKAACPAVDAAWVCLVKDAAVVDADERPRSESNRQCVAQLGVTGDGALPRESEDVPAVHAHPTRLLDKKAGISQALDEAEQLCREVAVVMHVDFDREYW